MITGLDHMVLVCPDIEAGIADYTTLLGAEPVWRHERDGAASALFQFENTALELLAPVGDGDTAARLHEIIAEDGPGLKSIVFGVDDVDAAHHTLTRRGLAPSEAIDQSVQDIGGERTRAWRRFRLADEQTHGVKTLVIKYDTPLEQAGTGDDAVHRLDHIVVTTPNPDRALAHYGARLGLDFKLDRVIEKFATRFLFFKTGELIFEVVNTTKGAPDPSGPDAIMGLTYEVRDLKAAHDRLSKAGRNVSEIRTGRKAGSTVFTVRDGTLEVPTLFIAHAPR
jgi:catechol 2,3-dioxygenase-like lactoylglutathione lyase family enzyme